MSTKNFFASFAMPDRQLLIRGKILSAVEFSGALSFCLHLFANVPSCVSSPCTYSAERHLRTPIRGYISIPCPAKNSPSSFRSRSHGSHGLTALIYLGRLGTTWDGLWDGLNLEIAQCFQALGRRDGLYGG